MRGGVGTTQQQQQTTFRGYDFSHAPPSMGAYQGQGQQREGGSSGAAGSSGGGRGGGGVFNPFLAAGTAGAGGAGGGGRGGGASVGGGVAGTGGSSAQVRIFSWLGIGGEFRCG